MALPFVSNGNVQEIDSSSAKLRPEPWRLKLLRNALGRTETNTSAPYHLATVNKLSDADLAEIDAIVQRAEKKHRKE